MSSMPESTRSKSLQWNCILAVAGVLSLGAVIVLSRAQPQSVGDQLTRNTIRLSLAWYTAALILMMRLRPLDWRTQTLRGQIARWCWTWGAASFLSHLGMAFHYFHFWSHSHAFEHTREVSGMGEGIYASYLFTALWACDVIWWWAAPQRYSDRSVWFDRLLHPFMLFIVFNGMVVFEDGAIRWAGLAMFGLLLATWLFVRRTERVGVAGSRVPAAQ
jgi:hypothetical protein